MDKTPKKLKAPPKAKAQPKTKAPPKAKAPSKTKAPSKVKGITLQYDDLLKNEIDENRYSEKIKSILLKIKNQNIDIDNRIRFCWKN